MISKEPIRLLQLNWWESKLADDDSTGTITLQLIAEVRRLRTLLHVQHLDADRCAEFPNGRQCVLRAGHIWTCSDGLVSEPANEKA